MLAIMGLTVLSVVGATMPRPTGHALYLKAPRPCVASYYGMSCNFRKENITGDGEICSIQCDE